MAIRIDAGDTTPKVVKTPKKKPKKPPASATSGYLPNGRPVPTAQPTAPPATAPHAPGAVTNLQPLYEMGKSATWKELRYLQRLAWTTKTDEQSDEMRGAIEFARKAIDSIRENDPHFSLGMDYKAFHDEGLVRNTPRFQQALTLQKLHAEGPESRTDYMHAKVDVPDMVRPGSSGYSPNQILDTMRAQSPAARKALHGAKVSGSRTVDDVGNGEAGLKVEVTTQDGKQFEQSIPFTSLPARMAEAVASDEDVVVPNINVDGGDAKLKMLAKAWSEVYGDTKVKNIPLEMAALLIGEDAPELTNKAAAKQMFLALKDPYLLDPRNPYRVDDPEEFFKYEAGLQEMLDANSQRSQDAKGGASGTWDEILTAPDEPSQEGSTNGPTGELAGEDLVRLDGVIGDVPMSIGFQGIGADVNRLVRRANAMLKKTGDPNENASLSAITMLQEWLQDVDPSIKIGDPWDERMDAAVEKKVFAAAWVRAAADPKDEDAHLWLAAHGVDDVEGLINNALAPTVVPDPKELAKLPPEERAELERQVQLTPDERRAELITGLAVDARLPQETPYSAVWKVYRHDPKLVTPEYVKVFDKAQDIVGERLDMMLVEGRQVPTMGAGQGRTPYPRNVGAQKLVSRKQIDDAIAAGFAVAERRLNDPTGGKERQFGGVGRYWHSGETAAEQKKRIQEGDAKLMGGVSKVFTFPHQVVTTAMETPDVQLGQELKDIQAGTAGTPPMAAGGKGGGAPSREALAQHVFAKEGPTGQTIRDWGIDYAEYIATQQAAHPNAHDGDYANYFSQYAWTWDKLRERAGGGYMTFGVYWQQEADPAYKPGDSPWEEFILDTAFETILYAPLVTVGELTKASKLYKAARAATYTKIGMETRAGILAQMDNPFKIADRIGVSPQVGALLAREPTPEGILGIIERHGLHDRVDPGRWGLPDAMALVADGVGNDHPFLKRALTIVGKATQSGEITADMRGVRTAYETALGVLDPADADEFARILTLQLANETAGHGEMEALFRRVLGDVYDKDVHDLMVKRGWTNQRVMQADRRNELQKLRSQLDKGYDADGGKLTRASRTWMEKRVKTLDDEYSRWGRLLELEPEAMTGPRSGPRPKRREIPDWTEDELVIGHQVYKADEREALRDNFFALLEDAKGDMQLYRYSRPARDPRLEEELLHRSGSSEDTFGFFDQTYKEELARTKELTGEPFISDGYLSDWWQDKVRGREPVYRRGHKGTRPTPTGKIYQHDVTEGRVGAVEEGMTLGTQDAYRGLVEGGEVTRAEHVGQGRAVAALKGAQANLEKTRKRAADKLLRRSPRAFQEMNALVARLEAGGLERAAAVEDAQREMLKTVAQVLDRDPRTLTGDQVMDFAREAVALDVPKRLADRWIKDWEDLVNTHDWTKAFGETPHSSEEARLPLIYELEKFAQKASELQSAQLNSHIADVTASLASLPPAHRDAIDAALHMVATGDPERLSEFVASQNHLIGEDIDVGVLDDVLDLYGLASRPLSVPAEPLEASADALYAEVPALSAKDGLADLAANGVVVDLGFKDVNDLTTALMARYYQRAVGVFNQGGGLDEAAKNLWRRSLGFPQVDTASMTAAEIAEVEKLDASIIRSIMSRRVTNAVHELRNGLQFLPDETLRRIQSGEIKVRLGFEDEAARRGVVASAGAAPDGESVIHLNLLNRYWQNPRAVEYRIKGSTTLAPGSIFEHESMHYVADRVLPDTTEWDDMAGAAVFHHDENVHMPEGANVTIDKSQEREAVVRAATARNATGEVPEHLAVALGGLDEDLAGLVDAISARTGLPATEMGANGTRLGSLTRALLGDPAEQFIYRSALDRLGQVESGHSLMLQHAAQTVRDMEKALEAVDMMVASGQTLLDEIGKNLADSLQKVDSIYALYLKVFPGGETRSPHLMAMRDDAEMFRHVVRSPFRRGTLGSAQPVFPGQRQMYAMAPWDAHLMMTWRMGPAARKLEELNSVPAIFGRSFDDYTNIFKTLILARVATALRIVLGDEATRFLPEGVNPIEARRQFKELLEYERVSGNAVVPPELRGSLARIYGTIKRSNYAVLDAEDADFLVSYNAAMRQFNQDPLIQEWRSEYGKRVETALGDQKDLYARRMNGDKLTSSEMSALNSAEDGASMDMLGWLEGQANAEGLNVVNHHLRSTNRLWLNEQTIRSQYSFMQSADRLQAMKTAVETQNVGQWCELVNETMSFYAQNHYTYRHFLTGVEAHSGDFRPHTLKAGTERGVTTPEMAAAGEMGDARYAPRTAGIAESKGLDNRSVMPSIIGRATEAERSLGPLGAPSRWFVNTLEGVSGYFTEAMYSHFYMVERTRMAQLLADRMGLNIKDARQLMGPGSVTDALVKKVGSERAKDLMEGIEREAYEFGLRNVQRTMYTSGTAASEDLLRNLILFLPAQRQYLAYWFNAIVQHPWLTAYLNRLNQLPDYAEVPLLGTPYRAKIFMRGLLFATPGFQSDPLPKKAYALVPGLGLPGVMVGVGANLAELANWNEPQQIANKLPGGSFYNDMWRPLNQTISQFGYALSTMIAGRPFQLMPEQVAGSNADMLYRYTNEFKAALARGMATADTASGAKADVPESGGWGFARSNSALRVLIEGVWNFVVPAKLTITDQDAQQWTDQTMKWEKLNTYGDRLAMLQSEKDTRWGKWMAYEQMTDADEKKGYLLRNPEIVPYTIINFQVIKPVGGDYDFDQLAQRTKDTFFQGARDAERIELDKRIDAEQKWFDTVYIPALKAHAPWVGNNIVGGGKEMGSYTGVSQYNLDRIEKNFLEGSGVFAEGVLDPKTNERHFGVGNRGDSQENTGLQKQLDDLGGPVYSQDEFPSTSDSKVYQAVRDLYELRGGARFVRTSKNFSKFADIYMASGRDKQKALITTAATLPFSRMSDLEARTIFGKRYNDDVKWVQQRVASAVDQYDKAKAKWEGSNKGDFRDSNLGEAWYAALSNLIYRYCAGPEAPDAIRGGIAKQMLYTPLVRPHLVVFTKTGQLPGDANAPTTAEDLTLEKMAGMGTLSGQLPATTPEQGRGGLDLANFDRRVPEAEPTDSTSGKRKVKYADKALPERMVPLVLAHAALAMQSHKHKDGSVTFGWSKADQAILDGEQKYYDTYLKTADPITKYNLRETERAYTWSIFLKKMAELNVAAWTYRSEYQMQQGGYRGRTYSDTTLQSIVRQVKKKWLPSLYEMSPLFHREFEYYNHEAGGNLLSDMISTFR